MQKDGLNNYRVVNASMEERRITTATVFTNAWNSVVTDLLALEKGNDYVDLQATSVLPGLHLIDRAIRRGIIKPLDPHFLTTDDAWIT